MTKDWSLKTPRGLFQVFCSEQTVGGIYHLLLRWRASAAQRTKHRAHVDSVNHRTNRKEKLECITCYETNYTHTHTHTHSHTVTHTLTYTQSHKHTDTHTQTQTQSHKQTDRQTDIHTHIVTVKQTERDTHTYTLSHMHTYSHRPTHTVAEGVEWSSSNLVRSSFFPICLLKCPWARGWTPEWPLTHVEWTNCKLLWIKRSLNDMWCNSHTHTHTHTLTCSVTTWWKLQRFRCETAAE